MAKGKGAEWEHDTVIEHKREQLKVQCKYCAHEFVGGASRIRDIIWIGNASFEIKFNLLQKWGRSQAFWAFWGGSEAKIARVP